MLYFALLWEDDRFSAVFLSSWDVFCTVSVVHSVSLEPTMIDTRRSGRTFGEKLSPTRHTK